MKHPLFVLLLLTSLFTVTGCAQSPLNPAYENEIAQMEKDGPQTTVSMTTEKEILATQQESLARIAQLRRRSDAIKTLLFKEFTSKSPSRPKLQYLERALEACYHSKVETVDATLSQLRDQTGLKEPPRNVYIDRVIRENI